eukprot:scaffold11964_cov90-Isochrysis_galbana.AAC.2
MIWWSASLHPSAPQQPRSIFRRDPFCARAKACATHTSATKKSDPSVSWYASSSAGGSSCV